MKNAAHSTTMTPPDGSRIQPGLSEDQFPFTVVKRNGTLVPFRLKRIYHALEAAFRDTRKVPKTALISEELRETIKEMTDLVVAELVEKAKSGTCLTVEGIQDLVEVTLMQQGHHDVARDYIIYRDQHKLLREDSPQNLRVVRRDGSFVRFNPMKIASSIEQAFRRASRISGPSPQEVIEAVNLLTQKVVARATLLSKSTEPLSVDILEEEIENQLMREGFFQVAKQLILHRSQLNTEDEIAAHDKKSLHEMSSKDPSDKNQRRFKVIVDAGKNQGKEIWVSRNDIEQKIRFACRGLEQLVDVEALIETSLLNFYEGIKESEVSLAQIMGARSLIEKEPAYSKVASRLLLDLLYRETLEIPAGHPRLKELHAQYFKNYVEHAVKLKRLHPSLLEYDFEMLGKAMDLGRDDQFTLLGLQTLYDRYFIHENQRRLETPQIFWMRVAMGLSLCEKEKKNQKAIEFYEVLSKFLFTSSTPTLFNSGTLTPQLSSCYLSTVMDDLKHIFKVISDDALLSKWAGGLGNDWTNVRATGASIKGTNGRSQGVIPFLKVANDTAVAVNQGGKRKGALCVYLETWHLDIEDFLELRKNTGDERRRTHDMNTANWIPDLFMKRVAENGQWTLFSPSDVSDLHNLYGRVFEERYIAYEKMVDRGEIKLFKRVEATLLWRKMLSMLFETGHPWITFKDPSNLRSPQDHVGVVHSSNLCTEILLNTSEAETAVCNLGSVNLAAHLKNGDFDAELLASTIRTAIRMLDNVVEINFYPTPEAQNANMRHRPIGLGIMGFQDVLYELNLSYASHEAVELADRCMELVSYHAILSSSELAKERGAYSTFKGSKWDRGLLPIDTLQILKEERGGYLDVDQSCRLDWAPVRDSIQKYGMRNSNTMAIAPTATISNIVGITQSIEPTYRHLYVKSNLSGEFMIPNPQLVEKLKELNIWDAQMIDDLKYFDGVISEIERIPEELKKVFLTAFEIEPEWLIECGSRRQKWIDMGQSLNLYLAEPSGKKLHQMYMEAWTRGLKTSYYLRTLAATQIEKSTTDVNARGIQPRWMKNRSASSNIRVEREEKTEKQESVPKKPIVCNLEEGCESCQ